MNAECAFLVVKNSVWLLPGRFLAGRSILLLDDIFSAVDSATERRNFANMREKFAGKTVLLVTHRAALLRQMDRILYLNQGSVVEDGSHDD